MENKYEIEWITKIISHNDTNIPAYIPINLKDKLTLFKKSDCIKKYSYRDHFKDFITMATNIIDLILYKPLTCIILDYVIDELNYDIHFLCSRNYGISSDYYHLIINIYLQSSIKVVKFNIPSSQGIGGIYRMGLSNRNQIKLNQFCNPICRKGCIHMHSFRSPFVFLDSNHYRSYIYYDDDYRPISHSEMLQIRDAYNKINENDENDKSIFYYDVPILMFLNKNNSLVKKIKYDNGKKNIEILNKNGNDGLIYFSEFEEYDIKKLTTFCQEHYDEYILVKKNFNSIGLMFNFKKEELIELISSHGSLIELKFMEEYEKLVRPFL